MYSVVSGTLVGSQIHGFYTLQDLNIESIMEEAKTRWLRPNEIYAILCNHNYFTINAKPLHMPRSGTIVLYDRKMLRNFRKDGYNWKKKTDGKTVKEAHEHLKVGNEERIHVYYAHGEDNPKFVRRIYWLLDKNLEQIVFVHYRETQEGSPATALTSNSSSMSVQSSPWPVGEDICYGARNPTVQNHEMRLDELNTLKWDDLLPTNDPNDSSSPANENISCLAQQHQAMLNDTGPQLQGTYLPPQDFAAQMSTKANYPSDRSHVIDPVNTVEGQVNLNTYQRDSKVGESGKVTDISASVGLQRQDSFEKWMDYVISDLPGSVDDPALGSSLSTSQVSSLSPEMNYSTASDPELIFSITDVSPTWAYSTEKTKILVTGIFQENYTNPAKSNLLCVCGDVCVTADVLQVGVYRCYLPPHPPGAVNLYMSFDGRKPISQVLSFEYRTKQLQEYVAAQEDCSKWEAFQLQARLSRLLFSTSRNLEVPSAKVSKSALHQAKKFAHKTSYITESWGHLMESIKQNETSFGDAKDALFDVVLKHRLKEWILDRVVGGCKSTDYDENGQGVIHLCAILGYTWAIHLFSWSGLSLDFRDKHGWSALHWAAYCGRETMVAVLLSGGAKPNLVTDPTSENPGGCTAADLAAKQGHDGLAAYLSEKALVAHFEDMKIAGNISGSLQSSTTETSNPENLKEDEIYLKDTLAAYRLTVEAASRIQVAFREHALKVQRKVVEFASPEEGARSIVAAMKIQHAFRNYERRKKMAAAALIQCSFRTWKVRKQFLNKRRQAIKIQAAFRGHRERRQYTKIVWSVGVLEKAILRWRWKRKGIRSLQTDPGGEAVVTDRSRDGGMEDFYKASQRQAEERLERSVVAVQAMFRSKQAQADYHRMKHAHEEARMEYEYLREPDTSTDP